MGHDASPSRKSFLDLGGEFVGESVEALGEIANVLQEIVVGDERRDGGKESGGGGDEGFGDTGSDSAEAGGTGSAEAGEGVNDAPDGAEQTDEGSDARGGGEPGHTLFDAANFVGGCQLHADSNGLQGLEFGRIRIAGGGGHLGLQLAVTCGVDVGERRAGGDESLRIGDALGGAENFEELVTLPVDAAEKAEFLEDERPRNQRKEEKDHKNSASDPSGLRKNVENIADVECG